MTGVMGLVNITHTSS